MKRKILISFLIVALAHYLIGCAVYKSAVLGYTSGLSESDKIVSVELDSNVVIHFDDDHGRLVQHPGSITGRTIFGNKVKYPLDEIGQIFTGKDTVPVSIEALRSDTTITISKLVQWYETVTFDSNGGRYMPGYSSILGKSVLGKSVDIPCENVKMTSIKNLDMAVSFLATIGLGIGLIFLYFALFGFSFKMDWK